MNGNSFRQSDLFNPRQASRAARHSALATLWGDRPEPDGRGNASDSALQAVYPTKQTFASEKNYLEDDDGRMLSQAIRISQNPSAPEAEKRWAAETIKAYQSLGAERAGYPDSMARGIAGMRR